MEVLNKVSIEVNNWKVPLTPRAKIGYSGENAVCELEFLMAPEEDFTYYLETENAEEDKNTILLTPDLVNERVYVLLTTEMLGIGGILKAQLVAYIDEEEDPVKKTNIFQLEVDNSINATKEVESHYQTALSQWTKILSEFDPQDVLAKLQEVEAEVDDLDDGVNYITNLACRLYKFNSPTPQTNPEYYPGIRNGDLTFASGDLYFAQGVTDQAITWKKLSGGGGGGTDDYDDLENKPSINNVTLSGNKTSSDFGLQEEITAQNKIDSDLVNDINATNKFIPTSNQEDSGKYLRVNASGQAEWQKGGGGGGGLTPTQTAPDQNTTGSVGDQLLVTTRPARIYTLISIKENSYIWVCTGGENIVFEEVTPEPEPTVDAELEVKRLPNMNAGPTLFTIQTPFFDYTAIDNIGNPTSYYKIEATCNNGYSVGLDINTNASKVGTWPTYGANNNTTNISFKNAAPYSGYNYTSIGLTVSPRRAITEEEVTTLIEDSNITIKVYNDQDQEVASYKMVNKVVD